MITTLKEFYETQEFYFTTSYPINILQFIDIEVDERENYDIDDVNEWISKYKITNNTVLIWVSTKEHIAARYNMTTNDWNNSKEIYEKNPESFNVIKINKNDCIIISESDDGDDGYLSILNNTQKYF